VASQFQNRLVGISILVASVVIFLPTVIDGKKTAYEDEFISTPIHPEVKEHTQQLKALEQAPAVVAKSNELEDALQVPVESEQDWQVQEIASTVTTDKAAVTEKEIVKEVVAVPTAKPVTPKKKKLPETAWTIQLGAFQNAANINSLLKTLHKAGFQAHTIPTEVIDGKLTRLFVGPDVSKEKLEKQLPRLKRLTKLQGKLLPFDAVNP